MADIRSRIVLQPDRVKALEAALSMAFAGHPVRDIEAAWREREELLARTRAALVGLVQADVARASGMSRTYVSRLAHGKRVPHSRVVQIHDAICRILSARGGEG